MNEYPENWDEIARETKEKAGWKCENCLHPHSPSSGHTLTVHHLDNDKSNCAPENLAALCQVCHLRYQNVDLLKQGWLFEIPDWLGWRLNPTPLKSLQTP